MCPNRLLTSAEAAAFLGRRLRFVEADLIRYLDGLRQQSLEPGLDIGFGRRSWSTEPLPAADYLPRLKKSPGSTAVFFNSSG